MATAVKESKNGHAKTKPRAALAKAIAATAEVVRVKPLKQKTIAVKIVGTAPYMQAKFSEKAKRMMMDIHEAGQQGRGKKVRTKRDYKADCEGATYKMKDGSLGIPASCFRSALISACRLVGFKMTIAKLSIEIAADGFDAESGTPMVKIVGKPEMSIMPARNANNSCDLRSRPMWREWSAVLRIRFDEDQFSVSDVVNLLIRVGSQVGIGEGRPDSRNSNGMGFGLFEVELE